MFSIRLYLDGLDFECSNKENQGPVE